jgi:cytochrome c553
MRHEKIVVPIALFAVALASPYGPAQATDATAEKSMLCAGCHGADGISVTPEIPNLAGQKETYLANTLRAFRAGERTNPIMMSIASDLSDAEIDALATHFSSIKLGTATTEP